MSLPRPAVLTTLLTLFSVVGAPAVARAKQPSSPKSSPASAPAQTATAPATTPAGKPAVLVLTQAAPGTAALVATIADRLGRSSRYALQPLAALRPFLRQHDAQTQLVSKATALREKARQAMLALDHLKAGEQLDAARALLEKSFIAFYEPTTLAELDLLRGVVALQRTRPDLARSAFTQALHLDPTLKPDAHYSPQVRAAFADARKRLPERPVPAANEVGRLLAQLPGGRWAVVLSGERSSGGLLVVRALTYEPKKHAYGGIEALAVAVGPDARSRAETFGARLRAALEARLPAPIATTRPASIPATLPWKKPITPPPTKAWYKRWYVWAIAGAVVTAAVAIPLATRREVVDVNLRW